MMTTPKAQPLSHHRSRPTRPSVGLLGVSALCVAMLISMLSFTAMTAPDADAQQTIDDQSIIDCSDPQSEDEIALCGDFCPNFDPSSDPGNECCPFVIVFFVLSLNATDITTANMEAEPDCVQVTVGLGDPYVCGVGFEGVINPGVGPYELYYTLTQAGVTTPFDPSPLIVPAAGPYDVGIDHGMFSGPYTVTVTVVDALGNADSETFDADITTNCDPTTELTIVKVTDPAGDGTDFTFTVNGETVPNVEAGDRITFDVVPGPITITEEAVPGWTVLPNGVECDIAAVTTPDPDVPTEVIVEIADGAAVTCTWTNTKLDTTPPPTTTPTAAPTPTATAVARSTGTFTPPVIFVPTPDPVVQELLDHIVALRAPAVTPDEVAGITVTQETEEAEATRETQEAEATQAPQETAPTELALTGATPAVLASFGFAMLGAGACLQGTRRAKRRNN